MPKTPSTSLHLRRALRKALGPVLLAFGLLESNLFAAEAVSKELQVQAVFLWRFAQFVQWPSNAFASAESPMLIGVLGENPFGNALNLAVKGETAHGRHIAVKYLTNINEVDGCHVLYICPSESSRVKRVLSAVAGKPTLTVSPIEGFATQQGGMIRFIVERGRVTVRINVEAATTSHLVLDARLLRLAEAVKTP